MKRKKKYNPLNIFLYKLDVILFKFLHKFSKEDRLSRRRSKIAKRKEFLKKMDFILFKFLKFFSKDSKLKRRKRREAKKKAFLRNLDVRLFKIINYFSKEGKIRRRKKRQARLKMLLYNLDVRLFKFKKYFSKEEKIRRKKRRQARLKLFLTQMDFRLFRFLNWFGKKSRNIRRRKRKEFYKYLKFRFNIFIKENKRKFQKSSFQLLFKRLTFFIKLYINIVIKPYINLFKWLKKIENRRIFLINSISSSILFIIAYFLTYFLYQVATVLLAKYYNIPAIIYYFKTDYLIKSTSSLWTRNNVILISFIGPFVSIVIAFIFLNLFNYFRKRRGLIKIFFLWCTLHAFNMFFGAYIAGILTNKGFGLVVAWLFFQLLLNISLSFISAILLIFIGYISIKYFLQAANHPSLIEEKNRNQFLISQALIPYIFGNIFIYIICLPDNKPYQTIILACMGFIVLPIIYNVNFKHYNTIRERLPNRLNSELIIIFLLLVLTFRIGLGYGFKF